MMNFGFNDLSLVNPCELSDEAYMRAVHADKILDQAQIFPSFNDAINDIDFLVATSSKETLSEKKHNRNPVFLPDFTQQIQQVDGTIGLVFGREDTGLFNDEIASCDLMVKIPSHESYETLNLSHSVGIFLYSIYLDNTILPQKRTPLDNIEKNHLYNAFEELLAAISYPEHKYEKTRVMFKRLISRSIPSKWEYHTLMGVINTAAKRLKEK
jgi:tRNA/rRNA methyltransferase